MGSLTQDPKRGNKPKTTQISQITEAKGFGYTHGKGSSGKKKLAMTLVLGLPICEICAIRGLMFRIQGWDAFLFRCDLFPNGVTHKATDHDVLAEFGDL